MPCQVTQTSSSTPVTVWASQAKVVDQQHPQSSQDQVVSRRA
jgi:hypothetical protein